MDERKKIISICFLLCFIYILILGCGPTIVTSKPPAPKTEIRPAKPNANAVWIDGYWKWSGGKYVWISGRWSQTKPGKTWVPGRWEQKGRGWVWVKGHWR